MEPDKSISPNASHFYCMHNHQGILIYSAKIDDAISISSVEEALNPNRYRSLSQPFAYVIINQNSREYILVRDHLGIQPLYYYYQSGEFIFGDTISDIIQQLPKAPALLDSEIAHLFGDVHSYTDNTLYKNIYRVEPGHIVRIKANGHIVKSDFWQLYPEGVVLHYQDEREYLEHFTSLMQESIKHATHGASSIAAEFSAGMDSTAIYGACAALGLNPTLFMHEPLAKSVNTQTYNKCYEEAFVAQFPLATIQRIISDNFDAIRVFKDYAAWFGGPSPYMFELFANPLHQAISAAGHTILLSGFGGDQGVSGHVPTRFIVPFLIRNKQFRTAWLELDQKNKLYQVFLMTKFLHPVLHQLAQSAQNLKSRIDNAFKKSDQQKIISKHPYHRHYFKTLREVEWSFLQGSNSHEIRMRIEYSSIVAKKMGFEYRYPLLYPKLLEFFLSLPVEQKRNQGVGRYLMRRYLSNILPTAPFNTYQKKEGLNILPTLDTFKTQWELGCFQSELHQLPFQDLLQHKLPHEVMIKNIQGFMLSEYLEKM